MRKIQPDCNYLLVKYILHLYAGACLQHLLVAGVALCSKRIRTPKVEKKTPPLLIWLKTTGSFTLKFSITYFRNDTNDVKNAMYSNF